MADNPRDITPWPSKIRIIELADPSYLLRGFYALVVLLRVEDCEVGASDAANDFCFSISHAGLLKWRFRGWLAGSNLRRIGHAYADRPGRSGTVPNHCLRLLRRPAEALPDARATDFLGERRGLRLC